MNYVLVWGRVKNGEKRLQVGKKNVCQNIEIRFINCHALPVCLEHVYKVVGDKVREMVKIKQKSTL